MTKGGGSSDDDQRLQRLYRDNYRSCVGYAARLIQTYCGNREILGVQAAEIFDEAMALYWRAGEHLLDHDDHERNIKRRVKHCAITWLRRYRTKTRTPPGPTVALDAPPVDADNGGRGEPLEVADPEAGRSGEGRVDFEDALDHLAEDERHVAAGRARGDTFAEIASEAEVSEETARERFRRAGQHLRDEL